MIAGGELVGMLIVLILLMAIWWVVNALIPLDERMKTIFSVAIAVVLLLWLLRSLAVVLGYRF